MRSLKSRLLVSSVIIFVVSIGFTGFVLDRSYVEKVKASLTLRLQSQLFDLLKNADLDKDGYIDLPIKTSDLRLIHPNSGHYAAVAHENKVVWYSPSNQGINIPYNTDLKAGQKVFGTIQATDGTNLYILSIGYIFIDAKDQRSIFTFSVAEYEGFYNSELLTFRHGLWIGLGAILLLLCITQGIILTWGLRPLAKVSKDLVDIEEGKRDYLDSNFIEEIRDLTVGLNVLLRFERARQERYKNSLGDLAHSFKTPLAIIKSIINHESIENNIRNILGEQTDTLNKLVTYQLRRAQTAGSRASLSKSIIVSDIISKILNALSKVYKDKNILVTQDVKADSLFYGDEGDLLEVLGNLLDNAHKWCKNKVKITTSQNILNDGTLLTITVEDDGKGIMDELKEAILKRGVRADQQTPGHGIGLSIVMDIVAAYCGELKVLDSELGGAKFMVSFKH